MSKIEWTDKTWNCITGCTKISKGCTNCYAERMSKRLQAMGLEKYKDGFDKIICHEDMLDEISRWQKPRRIFVNSMSDTFHEDVPDQFIRGLFNMMNKEEEHIFQVLTKRSERMLEVAYTRSLGDLAYPIYQRKGVRWTPNIWMGVTVEHPDYLFRIDDLRQTGAAVKWLSVEPLLAPMPDMNLDGIDWVVVGGESGPGARPMDPDWARDIRDQCRGQGIAYFCKQMSKKAPIPDDLMIREYPEVK